MASDLRSELPVDSAEATPVPDNSARASSKSESSAEIEVVEAPAAAARADLNLVSRSESSDASDVLDPSEETPSLGAQAVSGAQADSDAQGETTQSRGIPVWMALVGLVIAALVVGYQIRLNGQLAAEVTGLEAKLGRTEAVLGAHKAHLGDIRGGVRDLSAQLQSLQALVETEPVAARDASRD